MLHRRGYCRFTGMGYYSVQDGNNPLWIIVIFCELFTYPACIFHKLTIEKTTGPSHTERVQGQPIRGMNYYASKAFILHKMERELAPDLTYHGIHHTLDVLETTRELCKLEAVTPHDSLLLHTAALFHDSGFTISNRDHEQLGCSIARQHLPRFDYRPEEIECICGMIMATKIPQTPKTFLEAIICDADLDYLGREDFYEIGNTLFEELRAYRVLSSRQEWNQLQVRFLTKHRFFTRTNLRRRAERKQKHLKELVQSLPTW